MAVVALFDWRTLQREKESFVTDELGQEFVDLRFSVCLIGDRRRRRITLLFEHKSRPRYTTPRQLFSYLSRQFEEAADTDPLPSILTIVLLQSGTYARRVRRASDDLLKQLQNAIIQRQPWDEVRRLLRGR